MDHQISCKLDGKAVDAQLRSVSGIIELSEQQEQEMKQEEYPKSLMKNAQIILGPSLIFLSTISRGSLIHTTSLLSDFDLNLSEIDTKQLLILTRLGQIVGFFVLCRDVYVLVRHAADKIVLNDILSSYLAPIIQGTSLIYCLYALPVTNEQRRQIVERLTNESESIFGIDFSAERDALLMPGGFVRYTLQESYCTEYEKKHDMEVLTLPSSTEAYTPSTVSLESSNDCGVNNSDFSKSMSHVMLRNGDRNTQMMFRKSRNMNMYDAFSDKILSQFKLWIEEKLPKKSKLNKIGIFASLLLIFQLKQSRQSRKIVSSTMQGALSFSLIGIIIGSNLFACTKEILCAHDMKHGNNFLQLMLDSAKSIIGMNSVSNQESILKRRIRRTCAMMFAFYIFRNKNAIRDLMFGHKNRI